MQLSGVGLRRPPEAEVCCAVLDAGGHCNAGFEPRRRRTTQVKVAEGSEGLGSR